MHALNGFGCLCTLIPHKCSCSHTEGVQVHLESVIVFKFLLLL